MMLRLEDDEIRAVIERVRRKVGRLETTPSLTTDPAPGSGGGIFPTIDEAVEAARESQLRFAELGLEKRREVIENIRRIMRTHNAEMARRAVEETGIGRRDDKEKKNALVIEKTPGPEDLEPQVWTGDEGLTITEFAPFGVIGAIAPTTNPTSTIINNSIAAISAGNGIVFNAHPNAREISVQTIRWINEAIAEAGGPEELVTAISEPTIASAQELMRHRDTRILVITGGPGVVEEARKTRKRSILAGPGNPPVVIDQTADIELAGREIVRGASFDNNLICVDEKEAFVVDSVADDLLHSMESSGAHLLSRYELKALEKKIFREMGTPGSAGKLNPDFIGQDARVILEAIGVSVGDGIRLIVADVPMEHPLVWTEQMMPVFPVVRVRHVDEAIDFAVRAEQGRRHTASIFSRDVDAITRMARRADCSIFVANAANVAGLGDGGEGFTSFSIATPTGEGLTRPRSFSRERRLTIAGGLRIV